MLRLGDTFILRLVLVVVLAALLLPTAALGQATTGTISGTVRDQSGGVIPDAAVSVRNLDTNISRATTTQSDGRYNFVGLPVGRYELTTDVKGFATYIRGPITLVLNQEAVINPELTPAATRETVTVTEDALILNTTTAEVGVQFDPRRLSELPISGQFGNGGGFRDAFAAVLSAPGVSQLNTGNSVFTTGTNFSSNGSRTRGNNFMIDGQDTNEPGVAGRSQWVNNPDIIQEVRLITNQFLAEYGRSAGSVVSAITKSGTNQLHGSAFEFYNGNHLNSLSNLDKAAGFTSAPFYIEHQFGGTAGGRLVKDKTFWFGSIQRWTQRQLGSGYTIRGVPTAQGKQILQNLAGSRPQVAALLAFLPAADAPIGTSVPLTVGGQTVQIPQGTLTNSTSSLTNNWQWSARIDHQLTSEHSLGGRYLYNDNFSSGSGQVTPPGLTTQNPLRTQAAEAWLTSSLTARTLNELRLGWQRYGSTTTAMDPSSETIPSIEVPQLGLTGFNAASDRTAIGLAVNLPQYRFNNIYQIQDNLSYSSGAHALKFGVDLRRTRIKSLFIPQIRGRLVYDTLQTLVDDLASLTNINKPLPGGQTIAYYYWDDYFFFAQDTWRVGRTFTLNYGLRYEAPGNSFQSLYDLNDKILSQNNNRQVFALTNRPSRDLNNWQPRVGFSWNPQTEKGAFLSRITGGDRLVLRGGYARANDYTFLNIALNIFSAFPFVMAAGGSNVSNAWTAMPASFPDLSDSAALNMLNRTIVSKDFRSPISEQFSMELQREVSASTVFRIGYVGTKGTALFQTIDGNPRVQCSPIPTNSKGTVTGCPRVDTTAGIVRLRANAASSIYHSLQLSVDKRLAKGFAAGAHYTWSSFIDNASEVFNASTRGDIAVSQNSFDRDSDRGRATYDRPHRFSANFVYEIPIGGLQQKAARYALGGWQISSFITFQSGSPWTPLNGSDPTLALGGIDGLVGSAIRPNVNTNLGLSSMSVEEIYNAGGRGLFGTLPTCQVIAGTNTCTPVQRFGNAGRSILRSDGLGQIDLSVMKTTRIAERHQLQLRADFFNFTNTRNFGIPEARVSNVGFGNQWGTDGGNRRIFVSLKYVF